MSAPCGENLATAEASHDMTLNLLTSWPFSFIFSGGRSPALEFWLYGFKSVVQREHNDFSHDTCCISQDVYSLLASELCQIQAEACGCF